MERKRDLSWLKDWRVLILCGGTLFAGFLLGMLIFGSPWHLPPAWGDIPTWITAIATVGLVAGATITAIYAIRAFRAQSQAVGDQTEMLRVQSDQLNEQREINKRQTEVLELQAAELRESLEEREREAAGRRGAQAARVFIGAALHKGDKKYSQRDSFSPRVVNASDFPIYDARLWYPDETDYPDQFGTVLPNEEASAGRYQYRYAQDAIEAGLLTFRDSAGVCWIRLPGGNLKEQTSPTVGESVVSALSETAQAANPA